MSNHSIALNLSIFLWNSNVIKQHKNELFYLLHSKNIDITFIIETHLATNTKFKLSGYDIIHADHHDGTSHAGATIIIKFTINFNTL